MENEDVLMGKDAPPHISDVGKREDPQAETFKEEFIKDLSSFVEGKIVEGTMEASDDGTVSLKLQEMGLLPVRIGSAARQTALTRP